MSDQFTAQAAAQSTAQRFPLARGTTPPRARNVLLFLTDQQRKDSIGAYGGPGGGFQPVTPALDRLAAGGTRFERCYGTNPFCCP